MGVFSAIFLGAPSNERPVDVWTAAHTLAGVAAGYSRIRAVDAMGAAIAYEVLEYAIEWPDGAPVFGSEVPESVKNMGVDLLVYAAGYMIGRRIRR